MFVIRLPNGNLRVPRSATGDDGRVIGDYYVEIGPDDPDYARLCGQALTEQELAERKRRWQADDDELNRRFQAWKQELDAGGDPG